LVGRGTGVTLPAGLARRILFRRVAGWTALVAVILALLVFLQPPS
jgi:hypothetical protein